MRSSAKIKVEVIQKFRRDESDTGSSEVQVALLSRHIHDLSQHLKTHNKDFHSRRGLIHMVNRRRKLLSYLKGKNVAAYSKLIQDLNLRG